MSIRKSDLTSEEWSLLRDTPHLVAAAMASAGRSGLIGTFKEAMAACHQVYGGQQGTSELLREISAPAEVKVGQAAVREIVPLSAGAEAPQKLREAGLERLAAALQLLNSKDAPTEAREFKAWVIAIAQAVANAAKEGTFLGFGGERVSDAEESLLAELAQVGGPATSTGSP